MQAALTSQGYVNKEVFSYVQQHPFSLAVGDVAAIVQQLAEQADSISDSTTQQLRALLDLGVPSEKIVAALELLREAPFSIGIVEEAHASGAVLMRDHRQYSDKRLLPRITVHQARCLASPSKEDVQDGDIATKAGSLGSLPAESCAGQASVLEIVDRASFS